LAERFGLTAEQYAENLSWFKHDVVQDSVAPLDAAKDYISEYDFFCADDAQSVNSDTCLNMRILGHSTGCPVKDRTIVF
jgi:hypothetical protein